MGLWIDNSLAFVWQAAAAVVTWFILFGMWKCITMMTEYHDPEDRRDA